MARSGCCMAADSVISSSSQALSAPAAVMMPSMRSAGRGRRTGGRQVHRDARHRQAVLAPRHHLAGGFLQGPVAQLGDDAEFLGDRG